MFTGALVTASQSPHYNLEYDESEESKGHRVAAAIADDSPHYRFRS